MAVERGPDYLTVEHGHPSVVRPPASRGLLIVVTGSPGRGPQAAPTTQSPSSSTVMTAPTGGCLWSPTRSQVPRSRSSSTGTDQFSTKSWAVTSTSHS